MAGSRRWLEPADVVRRLRKRWDKGEFLSDLAKEAAWEPFSIGLSAPSAAELAGQFGAVQDWLETWRRVGAVPDLRLEWERIGGRVVGANDLPVRLLIEERDALWRFLGVRADVATFAGLLEQTRREHPGLVEWVGDHPVKTLAHAPVWPRLLAVVAWIETNASPAVYLRQIDAPGVDTKFVEKHRGILSELLDAVLPPEAIDATRPRSQFQARYRLARKPSHVRLRRLDGSPLLDRGPAELGLRVEDLAAAPIGTTTVYIVENDVTYLALPPVTGAVAILGEGYAVTRLASIGWLAERDVVYWGDLDTHGFVMLDRLRATFGAVRSMLMDRGTFLDHEAHWGQEDVAANVALDRLTPDEATLYQDLVEGRYGERLRLEQERVRFGAVRAAMTPDRPAS